jgi:hypothetical protein
VIHTHKENAAVLKGPIMGKGTGRGKKKQKKNDFVFLPKIIRVS